MNNPVKKLDLAMTALMAVYQDTKDTEIGDVLDVLSAWREEYIKDNSQFGVGA